MIASIAFIAAAIAASWFIIKFIESFFEVALVVGATIGIRFVMLQCIPSSADTFIIIAGNQISWALFISCIVVFLGVACFVSNKKD